jgi:peptide/nickel transport system permease protein
MEPWSWAKVGDMLRHIWVPMLILGTDGTARFTRIVRANLLDELKKPYVETARAKGLVEWR